MEQNHDNSSLSLQIEKLYQMFSKREKETQHEINSLKEEITSMKSKYKKKIENLQLNVELKLIEYLGKIYDTKANINTNEVLTERIFSNEIKSLEVQESLSNNIKNKNGKNSKHTSYIEDEWTNLSQTDIYDGTNKTIDLSDNENHHDIIHLKTQEGMTTISRKTLESLTQLIESRSEELNYLIEVLTAQESSTARVKSKVELLNQQMNEMKKDIQVVKQNIRVEEDTLLSLASQATSLKDCVATEIEENMSFRKKLKMAMDHSSENFKVLFQNTNSFSSQLKMIQSQITHIEKSKRDKLSTDEDLYQIYMEQANVYDQRFNSLKLQFVKMDKQYKKLSTLLYSYITKQMYSPPQDSVGTSDYSLHLLVYDSVREFHKKNLMNDTIIDFISSPIRIQPIRSHQYRIHDRNVSIVLQNEIPYVKLHDGTIPLEEYLKNIFAVNQSSPVKKINNNVSYQKSKDSIRQSNSLNGVEKLPSQLSPQKLETPTLKIDLTTPKSPPLSKLTKDSDQEGIHLHVNLNEVDVI